MTTASSSAPSVSRQPFGTTPAGLEVELFTLVNGHGLRAEIMNHGGVMTRLLVPDRAGQLADILLRATAPWPSTAPAAPISAR